MFREKTFFEKILPKVMGWYCSETQMAGCARAWRLHRRIQEFCISEVLNQVYSVVLFHLFFNYTDLGVEHHL